MLEWLQRPLIPNRFKRLNKRDNRQNKPDKQDTERRPDTIDTVEHSNPTKEVKNRKANDKVTKHDAGENNRLAKFNELFRHCLLPCVLFVMLLIIQHKIKKVNNYLFLIVNFSWTPYRPLI